MGFREALAALIAPNPAPQLPDTKAITDIYDWTMPTVGYLNVNNVMGLQHNHRAMVAMAVQWVGICSKFKAIACADTPLRLYRKSGKRGLGGKVQRVTDRRRLKYLRNRSVRGPGMKAAMYAEQAGEVEEILDSPILDLFHAPNPWDGPGAYHRRLYQSKSLTGQGYELICYDGDVMLLPLLPQWVRAKPDVERIVSGYLYGRYQGRCEEYDAEDVVHHKQFPSIDNPFYGTGDLQDVIAESHVFAYAIQYELYNMQNGIRPGDIAIKAKQGTTKDQVEMIRSELRKRYQGARQAGTPMIFVEAEPIPLMRTNKDMEYQEGMKRIVQQTLAAFGIPEDLVMRKEGSITIGGTGQKSDSLSVFQRMTVQPCIRAVCETWNSILLPRLGYEPGDVWLAYDDPCGDSTGEEVERALKLVPIGVMTINEARAEQNFDPIEGGDELRIAGRTLEAVDNPPEPMMGGGFGGGGYGDEGKAIHHKAAAEDSGPDDMHIAGPEQAMSDAMREYFRTIAPKFEEGVNYESGTIKVSLTPEEVGDFLKLTEPPLERAHVLGFNAGASQTPDVMPISQIAEQSSAAMRANQMALLRSVNDTTKDLIRNTLARGLESGEDGVKLATRVREVLGPENGARAHMIAHTETSNAFNGAKVRAWEESDREGEKCWVESGNPCPFCKSLAFKGFIPIDAEFAPGIKHPSGHPHCVLPETPVTTIGLVSAFRATYNGNVIAIRTASGRRASVTEKHKMLTARGFISASALVLGDDLLCHTGEQRLALQPNPNNAPTTAEQVFRSFSTSGTVTTSRVPTSTEYFHGDGRLLTSEIDIVSADCLFRGEFDTLQFDEMLGGSLVGALATCGEVSLSAKRDIAAMMLALRLAANGRVSLARACKSLIGRASGSSDLALLAVGAAHDSRLKEPMADDAAIDPHSFGDGEDRKLIDGIETDKIVGIEICAYSGHVYDFSTVSGMYTSNGIIGHNCRCGMRVRFKKRLPENEQ